MSTNSRAWDIVEAVSPIVNRMLLWGVPGTGKTTAAAKMGNPKEFYSLTLTEETTAAEIRGHYVPFEDQFIWQDGPAIAAWRKGCRVILNEIDHASGDVMTLLLAIMDDPEVARLTLPTKETVTPKEGFHVIATMNGEPDDLPPALRDRFQVCMHIPEPHAGAIASLSEDLRKLALAGYVSEDPERRVSIRAWKSFDMLRKKIDEKDAAYAVWGKKGRDVLSAIALQKKA